MHYLCKKFIFIGVKFVLYSLSSFKFFTFFYNFITINFIATEYYRVEYLCLFYSEKIFIYNEKDIQISDLISIPLKGHVNEV